MVRGAAAAPGPGALRRGYRRPAERGADETILTPVSCADISAGTPCPASGADLVRLREVRRQHERRVAREPLADCRQGPRHQPGTDLVIVPDPAHPQPHRQPDGQLQHHEEPEGVPDPELRRADGLRTLLSVEAAVHPDQVVLLLVVLAERTA